MSDDSSSNDLDVIAGNRNAKGMEPSIIIAAGVGFLLFFILIWMRHAFPKFFMPKIYQTRHVRHPPDLSQSSGWFNFIPYTLRFKESDLFEEYGGLDMVLYLSFLKYSIVLFAVLFLLGIPALIVNITGNGGISGDYIVTMSNIAQKSPRLWVHAISVIVFTFAVGYFIYRLQKKATRLQVEHLKRNEPMRRTVMVSELTLDNANHNALKDNFGRLYGRKQVGAAYVVPNTEALEKMRLERDQLIIKYKDAEEIFRETGKETQARDGICGPKMSTRALYEKRIRQMNEMMREEQNKATSLTRTGFVMFGSTASALQCAQTRHHMDRNTMTVSFAPDPREVNWQNLHKRKGELAIRYLISTIILVALFLFWTLPVIFIAGWSNIESLSQVSGFHWLRFILDLPDFVVGIITGFLPGLALVVFMALLPLILNKIFGIRKYFLKSTQERVLLVAYYLFLLFNVFLIVTIAGSATSAIQKYINSPMDIPSDLAKSLPGQGSFYFNYVAVNAFITNMIFLLRIGEFIQYLLKIVTKKSNYEKNQVATTSLPYFKSHAIDLIIFTVGVVYSVMNPIVPAIVCAYFCLSFFVVKYYLVYIHKSQFDGMQLTRVSSGGVLVSMVIFTLTMVGLFSILVFPGGIAISFVMFILTILFTVHITKNFSTLQKFAPLTAYPRPNHVPEFPMEVYRAPGLYPIAPFEEIMNEEKDIENQQDKAIERTQSIEVEEDKNIDVPPMISTK